jgi:hypothetical protein
MSSSSSALFTPYRAVGLVCAGEGLSVQHLGSASFLATPLGGAYQVYECAHLGLAFVSRQVPATLT